MASFLKDLISVGLSKGGVIIFGLAQSVIIARFLGPELNGVIAALLVYPSLFMTIGSLGVRQSTAFFTAKGNYSEIQIKTAVSQIWVFSTIISLVASYFLIRYFSNSGDNIILVLLALAPIPFALFNTYNSGIFLGKNQIQAFNKINWLPPLFVLIGTIVFVIVLDMSIEGALLALIAGPAIMSLIMLWKNRFIEALSLRLELAVIKSLLSLGIVYAIVLLIINLNYKLDIILLDKLSIPYETGIYSKGSAIIQYLWQIPMLLSTIVFARSAVSKNNIAFSLKVAQLLRLSFIAVFIGSLLLFIFSDLIILGMFGEEFRESTSVLNILLPGVLLLTIFKVMNMDLAGKGKPWVALKAMGPALVINIILNVLWIPGYGADGAAAASTISYSIAALLFLFFYSKEAEISIKAILYYKRSDFEPVVQLFNKFNKK